MTEGNPIQVAGRTFFVLEYLALHGGADLSDITKASGLNKSTVHRILQSLQYMGYVHQKRSGGIYEASFKIVELADAVRERVDVIGLVRPYLRELKDRSGETVHFVKREGAEAVYIDKVESYQNAVQMVSRIGNHIPVFCSAVGKAIAATLPDYEVEEIWKASPVTKRTANTITDLESFCAELEEIRKRGYAVDDEENEPGIRCVAAAVSIAGAPAEYAFSISAPADRMDEDRVRELSEMVLRAQKKIRIMMS